MAFNKLKNIKNSAIFFFASLLFTGPAIAKTDSLAASDQQNPEQQIEERLEQVPFAIHFDQGMKEARRAALAEALGEPLSKLQQRLEEKTLYQVMREQKISLQVFNVYRKGHVENLIHSSLKEGRINREKAEYLMWKLTRTSL